MREIKFRAWDKLGGYMIKEIKNLILPHSENEFGTILMQYTGLKDKNGKEIYEGDILKFLVHYPADFQERNPYKRYGRICGPVLWEEGWLYADKKEHNGQDDMLLYQSSSQEFEIIGNIYQNPELLNN